MNSASLWLYEKLEKVPMLRHYYRSKMLAIVFCTTQLPLLLFLVYLLVQNREVAEHSQIWWNLAIALLLNLAGSGMTFYALRHLMAPIDMTSIALRAYLKDGTLPYLPTQFDDMAGRLMADTNLTVRKLEQTIRQVTDYDPVTGLPNGNTLQHRIEQEIKDAYTYQWLMATVHLTLIGMQNVGSTWGTEHRDQILKQVAKRLSQQLQTQDLLARTETYSFTIVRGGFQNEESVEQLAQKMLKVFHTPFELQGVGKKGNGAQIFISAGAGISIYPTDGKTSDLLLQRSTAACQQSLREGRNIYRLYVPLAQKASEERLTIEQDLRSSCKEGHFHLLYQPRIDLKTGQPVAVEALVRWKHPRLGLIPPAQFIPIAEETGLIVKLGEWILYTACAQARAWEAEGLPPIRMAVNMSALQLANDALVDRLGRILAKTGLPPQQLELELTESIFIKDSDRLVELLNHFRQMGIRLALDDFGTGYSSLSYLSRLPVDTLKVDQSFTRRMNTQADIKSIVQAIVAMAKTLNLQITAEGVETHDHLQLVAQMECDEAQGYLFSRPISAVAMSRFLQQPLPSFLSPNPNGRIHVIMPDESATRRQGPTTGMKPIKIVEPPLPKPPQMEEPTRKMKQTLPVPADQIWRSQPTQQVTKIERGE